MSDFNIFISYSHKDEAYALKLENHLAVLKKQNLITKWYDRDISAGEAWSFEADKHLKDAQIILLLIALIF